MDGGVSGWGRVGGDGGGLYWVREFAVIMRRGRAIIPVCRAVLVRWKHTIGLRFVVDRQPEQTTHNTQMSHKHTTNPTLTRHAERRIHDDSNILSKTPIQAVSLQKAPLACVRGGILKMVRFQKTGRQTDSHVDKRASPSHSFVIPTDLADKTSPRPVMLVACVDSSQRD